MTADLTVVQGDEGLELRTDGDIRGAALDLDDLARRVRDGRGSALARACGARPGVTVLDGMAGLGLDGLTLAALGCHVVLVEVVPMVHRVLADGVDRARRALPGLGRVQVRCADVYHVLQEGALYDVVYLDPMFPRRQKAALPQKRAQLLAMAAAAAPVAPATADLIDTAVRVARLRVVLKRRARDPVIGLPDWTVRASRVRFDVYRGGAQAGV